MKDLLEYQIAFGQAIKHRREQIGFSREKLSKLTGRYFDSMVSIEAGSTDLAFSEIFVVASALSITPSILLALAESFLPVTPIEEPDL